MRVTPPVPGRSPPSCLSVLFSRRFRFLPLVSVAVVFACLVLVYTRSLRDEHVPLSLASHTHPSSLTDPADASHSHDHSHQRPPPDEGDASKARLPVAEDETERLKEMLALHAQHLHEEGGGDSGGVHHALNHTREVLTPAQQARVDRLMEEERNATLACQAMAAQLNIVPGSSWGAADSDQRLWWRRSSCDALLVIREYRAWLDQHPELDGPVMVSPTRVSPGNRTSATLDVIAICISTTSRHLQLQDIEDMTLFKSLLPSIGDTVEEGFEYWVYLLYDEADPFLDTDDTRAAIQRWFDGHLIEPLAKRGIPLRLVPVRYHNFLHKPGPAFNYMTHLAYIDGVDWVYRINDDTYFMSPFASTFVKALQALGPPFGVIGPLCREGATAILTHDFTHRTHHEVMRHHYPPILSDWWMDDWISRVYGRQRTQRSYDVVVKHLVKSTGTKYDIDGKHALMLATELEKGRRSIERYLEQRGMTKELEAYQHDDFHFSP